MADTIFCNKCGTPLDGQARFCFKCGATITPVAATSAPPQPYPQAAPAPAPQYATSPPQYGNVPQYGAMPPVAQPYGAMPPAPPQYGAVAPGYAPTPYTAVTPYAGFWLRVGACLLDALILFLPAFVMGILPILGIIIDIVGVWLYFALQESSVYQATLGKRALNIYVTDTYGRRLTFGRATGRHFAKIISSLTLCIGYIIVAFTEKKQGLHDFMAETLVLRMY
jgi:uncharacterized RDD family membrane protein YckC